ncbi:FadR/GntR family transcriptional regulator [Microbacterium alcoholitolerans]|uniref:FadR/GntR family transcriptional regulator n=1 Tax=unclassified Microbacterium TaxID=2609290 RepID=UPI003D17E3F4
MTGPTIDQRSSRRAFEEVLDQLESAIAAGEYSPGDRLPSERDLAVQLNASRPSIREALRVLEALGVVDVQRGTGHGITLRETPATDSLAYLFRFHLALRHVDLKSVADILTVYSRWAIREATKNSAPLLASVLEEIVARMQDDRLSPEQFDELDVSFHLAVVIAADNEFGTLVIEGCRSALSRLIEAATVTAKNWPARRRKLAKEHLDIFLAIRDGDADKAETLLTDHLTKWIKKGISKLEKSAPSLHA